MQSIKKELMLESKIRYKNKILRLKNENKKNLVFYKNKKQFLENIRNEIKEIILCKSSKK